MVKKFMKKGSKRVKARQRYKVEKKVRDHHKKLKKLARKKAAAGGSKNKGPKDPGIPRMLPFRDQIVAEALAAKTKAEEAKRLEKEKKRAERKRSVGDSGKSSNDQNALSALALQAAERQKKFEAKRAKVDDDGEERGVIVRERSTSAYYHDLKKVIEKSDVLLEVIDARDPMGTRCQDIEQRILSTGKRLILVMNKIDLVPRETVQQWLRILQSQLPCVAFKASTQTQRSNLSQKRGGRFRSVADDTTNSSRCFGAESLLKILGNYCRIKDVRTSITVGIIGLPNTGKSSVINSLKRSKVCQVGAHAGVTRNLQEINLDKHIRLIDSPGVIFAKHLSQDEAVLRNCINPETVADPIPLVQAIINRCSTRCLMLAYNLPAFETVNDFLGLMAQHWGKIKKGGVPDLNQAAKMVLRDWNNGKLGYYTEPPTSLEPIKVIGGSAQVVTELAKEFDLDAITEEQFKALQENENDAGASSIAQKAAKVSSIGPISFPENALENAQSDDDEMEERSDGEDGEDQEDEQATMRVDEQRLLDRNIKKANRKLAKPQRDSEGEDNGMSNDEENSDREVSNLRNVNRSRNLDQKRMKKQQRKLMNRLSAHGEKSKDAVDDAFDFDECEVSM